MGVDQANVVDMLVPGKAAARVMEMGDTIVEWNGQALYERRGGWFKRAARRLRPAVLAEVAVALEVDEDLEVLQRRVAG